MAGLAARPLLKSVSATVVAMALLLTLAVTVAEGKNNCRSIFDVRLLAAGKSAIRLCLLPAPSAEPS